MRSKGNESVVTTVRERCRSCYTCVRECPAKAIRILGGQAEIMADRCIACGNCVKVCRQNAKQVISSTNEVFSLLSTDSNVAAILAPSFAAEFPDIYFMRLVGMIRALGFSLVNEVAFGADIVAKKTKELLDNPNGKHYITTTCPAVFGYVKRYHPNLITYLAPIVSPMVATSRVLKNIHGKDLKVVFIGPCPAKKGEAATEEIWDDIDEVITFAELREMFEDKFITPDSVIASDFDTPHGYTGALFPVSKGMLQAAGIDEDLVEGDVVSAEGKINFIEAIKEFESDDLHAKLVDVMCCNGCIMGAGMTTFSPLFQRRARVSRYVRQFVMQRDVKKWEQDINDYENLDYSRTFAIADQRLPIPKEDEIRKILLEMGKCEPKDELNCGACGYDTCREHSIAILQGFAEDKMCLPYSISQLSLKINELDDSNDKLARTKEALMQSEKLASMGQLAAGIAHELNNPLGVVLMYTHIILEELESENKNVEDLKVIVQEADRCKKIVSGLLNFARKNKVIISKTNITELINQCLKLIQIPENIKLDIDHQNNKIEADIDRDQIIQVINNLITNAITAMPKGGNLVISTKLDSHNVQILVADSGVGISEKNKKKIFEPFFTTKQIGQGTGLGLAVIYGIIKMHKGNIVFESNDDLAQGETGTTFTVTLPLVNENSSNGK